MTDHTPAPHFRIQYPRLRTVVGATALAAGLSFAPVVAPAGSAFFTAAGWFGILYRRRPLDRAGRRPHAYWSSGIYVAEHQSNF